MGKAEREKGKSGEREVAALLRAHGFVDAHRTAQNCGRSGDAADVVGIDGMHLEVKRCETTKIHDWMAQAVRDASGTGKMPVVLHRRNKGKWLATLSMESFLTLVSAWISIAAKEHTADGCNSDNRPVITCYNTKQKGGQDDTE